VKRDRIRRLLLAGVLVVAFTAFGYFGLVRSHDKHPITMAKTANQKEVSPAAPAPSQSSPESPAVANAIYVAPEKQQLIGMHSVAAAFGTLTKDIRLVGKVSYDETRVTHIHSKVSGYIEDVFADSIGEPVRAGDPLFTIYSPDLVATEQDYLLALKSRDLLKTSTLVSAAQGAENLIQAARERLRLWDVTDQEIQSLESRGTVKRAIAVYSPVTGVVMDRAAYHHGTFVDPTKDLFTIVDLLRVWVLGDAYETDLPFIRTGQAATIELPYSGGGRKLFGHVDFVYPFLDPKTRTVQVRMEFANPGLLLKPDMFTNIELTVRLGRQLLIPQDALMDTGVEQYVFIDKGNGYVEPRPVKASAEAGENVAIERGLREGERVVTGANFIVDSESRLKGAFAGMGSPSAASQPSQANASQAISVEVLEPRSAKTGINPMRLLVKDANGKPITGAQVDVGLFMPQMGSMAPMRSNATLSEVGNGVYTGRIEIQMAWTWQTTVTVQKNGSVVGVARTSVTAH